jgi:hypothetical protein
VAEIAAPPAAQQPAAPVEAPAGANAPVAKAPAAEAPAVADTPAGEQPAAQADAPPAAEPGSQQQEAPVAEAERNPLVAAIEAMAATGWRIGGLLSEDEQDRTSESYPPSLMTAAPCVPGCPAMPP